VIRAYTVTTVLYQKSDSYFKGPDIRVISLVKSEKNISFSAFFTSFNWENPTNADL